MVSSASDWIILVVVAMLAFHLGTYTENSKSGSTQPSSTILDLFSSAPSSSSDSIDPKIFPLTQPFYVSKRPQLTLFGVGQRKLAILNVYSLGMYLPAPIIKSLQKAKPSPKVCTTILESTAPKAVMMQFSMSVGPERIAEAISQVKDAGEAVKKQLYNIIIEGMASGGKMKKNDQMTLEWKNRDTIAVTIRGVHVGQVQDKALAKGVLELYVGDRSVSPTLRKDLGCV